MKHLKNALGLTLLVGALAACQERASSDADTQEVPRSITVSGEGYVDAKPDMAAVTVGVVTQGSTAATALTDNSARMTALFELLKSLGIDQKDVQTTNLSVSPRYSVPDPAQPNSDRTITGYDASNDLTVRVRDLSRLGTVLDKFVTTAGANTMRGLSYDFATPEPLLDAARKNAVADAKRKADLYAAAAGIKLGAVQSIGESGGYYPKQSYAMAERSMAVPVSAGESRVMANVSITYAIE